MACLLVPAAEAVITTIAAKVVESKEKKNGTNECSNTGKVKLSRKLGWLNKLLWGGSALLAFEHIWHGEIIPSFPFLTAIKNGEVYEMLGEMGSAGVAMAVLVTTIWGGMVITSSIIEKRAAEPLDTAEEGAH